MGFPTAGDSVMYNEAGEVLGWERIESGYEDVEDDYYQAMEEAEYLADCE